MGGGLIGDRHAKDSALGNLGAAYADLGEPRRAIAVLGEALVILEAIESPTRCTGARNDCETDQQTRRLTG
jgi:hypothetical protein